MLSLLAALLLTGPPSARADDAPAAQAALDPADADGDGTVTGKERRQKRRADRRARRAARGESPQSDAELDAAEAAESSARGAAASGRASAAAAALKSSLPSADAGGGLPGASEGKPGPSGEGAGPAATTGSAPAAATATGPAAGATGDPGSPRSPSDFALAARSGYAPAFAAAGLKLAPDGRTVVRLDGRPATPEDYARLRREISSLPAALGRRPDFFSVVSPGHYADLKRGYKDKKDGDEVYKDVGTTEEDRDFIHTASCSKLSGDCNKSVEKASYKKGDFVAPEDLDSMWEALQKELDGSAESGGLPSLAATRAGISRTAAMEAARALGDGGMDDEDAIRSATGEGMAAPPTAVSAAAASVRRLWRIVSSSVARPGTGGAAGESSAPPLALGALAFAALGALGAGALFFRRKG